MKIGVVCLPRQLASLTVTLPQANEKERYHPVNGRCLQCPVVRYAEEASNLLLEVGCRLTPVVRSESILDPLLGDRDLYDSPLLIHSREV